MLYREDSGPMAGIMLQRTAMLGGMMLGENALDFRAVQPFNSGGRFCYTICCRSKPPSYFSWGVADLIVHLLADVSLSPIPLWWFLFHAHLLAPWPLER